MYIYVKSVIKALELLEALQEPPYAWGCNELARKLNYSSSSVSRLLLTLEYKGYIYKNPKTNKYKIINKVDLKEICHPFMEELSNKTGETVAIGVLKQSKIIHIARVESTEYLKASLGSFRLPAYAFAIGKYLLAWKKDEELDELLPLSFSKITKNTISTREDLKKELKIIRKNNYAMDNEEGYEGVRCIATGIHGQDAKLIAGISIIAPAYRFPDSLITSYKKYLFQVAEEISEKAKFLDDVSFSS